VDSDELVRSLVADLAPVRRLRSAGSRATLWAVLAVSCVGLAAYAVGARSDLADKLRDPAYLAKSVALLLVFAGGARCAFQLSIPGGERSPRARTIPVIGLVVWVLLIASRWSPAASAPTAGADSWVHGLPCVLRMVGLGLVPGLAILVMLRRAAPREPGWTGWFAFVAVTAVAILGTQMICMTDEPGHVLWWHVVPVLISAAVGAGAGRSWLGSAIRATARDPELVSRPR
jgi:hypothetical protein